MTPLVPLEVLHLPLVLFGGVPRGKGPQVLAPAGFASFFREYSRYWPDLSFRIIRLFLDVVPQA